MPVEHAQTPAPHCSPPVHAFPQVPQFESSVAVVVHALPQKVCPVGQAHTPATQDFPPLHTVLQVPQLALSVVVLVHVPLHDV
jgi:hypothetical protein